VSNGAGRCRVPKLPCIRYAWYGDAEREHAQVSITTDTVNAEATEATAKGNTIKPAVPVVPPQNNLAAAPACLLLR
jgi:hypothetical protein